MNFCILLVCRSRETIAVCQLCVELPKNTFSHLRFTFLVLGLGNHHSLFGAVAIAKGVIIHADIAQIVECFCFRRRRGCNICQIQSTSVLSMRNIFGMTDGICCGDRAACAAHNRFEFCASSLFVLITFTVNGCDFRRWSCCFDHKFGCRRCCADARIIRIYRGRCQRS